MRAHPKRYNFKQASIPDIMINKIKGNVFQFYFNEFGSCVYLIILKNQKILIDTSSDLTQNELINDLNELKYTPQEINIILLTHKHFDHTGNIHLFKNAKVYDETNIDEIKKKIPEIKIIKTPGHSEDSLCFLYNDILFSGDTIFHEGGRGRTDFPGGSEKEIFKSIKKLSKIKYEILCPGHI